MNLRWQLLHPTRSKRHSLPKNHRFHQSLELPAKIWGNRSAPLLKCQLSSSFGTYGLAWSPTASGGRPSFPSDAGAHSEDPPPLQDVDVAARDYLFKRSVFKTSVRGFQNDSVRFAIHCVFHDIGLKVCIHFLHVLSKTYCASTGCSKPRPNPVMKDEGNWKHEGTMPACTHFLEGDLKLHWSLSLPGCSRTGGCVKKHRYPKTRRLIMIFPIEAATSWGEILIQIIIFPSNIIISISHCHQLSRQSGF